MNRVTRGEFLREATFLAARRGTCPRKQVGTIAVDNGRIVASGYNGAPAGVDHCIHEETDPKDGTHPGCQVAVHAEANMIAFCARKGISLEGLDLYCTDSPCIKCAQLIINAGFKSVSYYRPYRLTGGVDLLNQVGIRVYNLENVDDQEKDEISHHPV